MFGPPIPKCSSKVALYTVLPRATSRPRKSEHWQNCAETLEVQIDTPHLYLPEEISMFASHEVPNIDVAMPPERTNLDYIKARLIMPRRSFDVDTLLHVHQISLHAEHKFCWLQLLTVSSCISVILLILYFSSRLHFSRLILSCFPCKPFIHY